MRAFLPGAALPWALVWVLAAAPVAGAPAGATLSIDIPPQSLGAALEAFGESTGMSVHWPPDADTLQSPGARAAGYGSDVRIPDRALGADPSAE